MADTLADLMREVGIDPSALQAAIAPARPPLLPQRAPFGSRPMPRQMRRPEVRAADPRLAPAERTRAYNQLQRTQNPQLRGERLPPSNQFAESGQMALEMTGVPAAGRSGEALHEGRYGDAAWEGGASLLALGSLALPLPRGGGARVAPRPIAELAPAIRPPPRLPATTEPPRPANVNRARTPLDDRFGLPDGPGEAASSGWLSGVTEGNENALYVWAHDAHGNRGGNALDGPFDTIEDAQRVASQLRAQGRFPHISVGRSSPEPPPRQPPRLPGRASDGSVLPVRPTEPFRNSLRGGSDDLMEAAQPTSDAVQPNTPRPTPSDATRGGAEFRAIQDARGSLYAFDGPRGSEYRVSIEAPDAQGRHPVNFAEVGDRNAARLATGGDQYQPLGGFSTAEARRVYRAVTNAMRRDAEQMQRPAYIWRGRNVEQNRLYAHAFERIEPPAGYVRERDPTGAFVWRRPSSDATRGGAQPTSDGGNARPPPDLNKSYRRPKPPSGGFLLPRRR